MDRAMREVKREVQGGQMSGLGIGVCVRGRQWGGGALGVRGVVGEDEVVVEGAEGVGVEVEVRRVEGLVIVMVVMVEKEAQRVGVGSRGRVCVQA